MHKTIRFLVTPLAAVLFAAVSTAPAHAALTRKDIGAASSCTNLLAGGTATAYVGVSGYGTADRNATSARLAEASVFGSVKTCPQGYSQAVNSIKVTLSYTVTFAEVTECEVGLPSGVTCTLVAAKTARYTKSKTCTNTAGCTVNWPDNILVQSNNLGMPTLIQFKGHVTANRGEGPVSVTDLRNW